MKKFSSMIATSLLITNIKRGFIGYDFNFKEDYERFV